MTNELTVAQRKMVRIVHESRDGFYRETMQRRVVTDSIMLCPISGVIKIRYHLEKLVD